MRQRVATVADVPEGLGRSFDLNGHIIALFRVGGTFYALHGLCSHGNAQLAHGDVDTDEALVACPLHGALFDLKTGQPRTLPAYNPVATYRVWVEGDDVFVELEDDDSTHS